MRWEIRKLSSLPDIWTWRCYERGELVDTADVLFYDLRDAVESARRCGMSPGDRYDLCTLDPW